MEYLDHIPPERKFPSHEQALRQALDWVRGRYDGGATSPSVAAVLKMIEVELAWLAHRGDSHQ